MTIHPAVEKAASYFDVTIVHVPLKGSYEVDLAAYEKVSIIMIMVNIYNNKSFAICCYV